MKKLFSLILMVSFSLLLSSNIYAAEIIDNILPNDVDNPYTVAEIQATLTVFDDLDGDLTESVYIILDNYTGHETDLGEFIIVFGVIDSGLNEVTYALTIKNVDITSPVFELIDISSLLISQNSNLSQNLPNIIAVDSHEGDLTHNITIIGLDLIDTSVLGDYVLTYQVSDSSGNEVIEEFTVSVIDSVYPEMSGPDMIIKQANYILPGDFFLQYFSATDNLDGIITNKIIIVSNAYLGNANIPGTYEIVFSVSDDAGNVVYHSLTIQVKTDTTALLIVDDYYLVIESRNLFVDLDFINVLKSIGDLPNSTYIFTNIVDTYTSSFSTEGTYTKTFSLLSSTGEDFERSLTIKVVFSETNVVEETESPPTFLANVWLWLKKWWWTVVVGILIFIGVFR